MSKAAKISALLLVAGMLLASACATHQKVHKVRKCNGQRGVMTPMGPM